MKDGAGEPLPRGSATQPPLDAKSRSGTDTNAFALTSLLRTIIASAAGGLRERRPRPDAGISGATSLPCAGQTRR